MEQSPGKSCDQSLALLERSGWLAEQSRELQQWFADNGHWRYSQAGQLLFGFGDEADGMYGLGYGAMDIEYQPRDLEQSIVIRAHPGSWMGQDAVIPGSKRPVSLRTPMESRIFFVSRQKLGALLADRPEFWPAFYALAVRHALEATEFLCEALSLLPMTRLARLLLRLSENTVEVVISQEDIGVMLGLSRSSLRRAIRSLTEAGAISTGYGRIDIRDRCQLQQFKSDFE